MTRPHVCLPPFVRLLPTLSLALAAVLGVSVATAAPAVRNPPDAFLPQQAQSVGALVRQVQTNATVRRRYARFFHVSEGHIVGYLRANLVASRLGRGGVYTVYYVRPNGLIYPTMLTLPNGSAVFALRGGPAIMTQGEGSPLIRYRTAVETHIVPGKPSPIVEDTAPSQTIVPAQVNSRVVPTVEQTPVYQPAPEDDPPAAASHR